MENTGFVLINLLPYRQKIKSDKLKILYVFLGLFVAVGFGLVTLGYTYVSLQLDNQELKNLYITKENKKLDEQIAEISTLKNDIRDTLAKRQVVESLQTDRSDGVKIMNELSNQLPEGSLLRTVKKMDDRLIITGQTQSSTKVSNYVTDLEKTDVFEKSNIIEVKTIYVKPNGQILSPNGPNSQKLRIGADDVRINEFTIELKMKKLPPIDLMKESGFEDKKEKSVKKDALQSAKDAVANKAKSVVQPDKKSKHAE